MARAVPNSYPPLLDARRILYCIVSNAIAFSFFFFRPVCAFKMLPMLMYIFLFKSFYWSLQVGVETSMTFCFASCSSPLIQSAVDRGLEGSSTVTSDAIFIVLRLRDNCRVKLFIFVVALHESVGCSTASDVISNVLMRLSWLVLRR
jgi:hypothetical protein